MEFCTHYQPPFSQPQMMCYGVLHITSLPFHHHKRCVMEFCTLPACLLTTTNDVLWSSAHYQPAFSPPQTMCYGVLHITSLPSHHHKRCVMEFCTLPACLLTTTNDVLWSSAHYQPPFSPPQTMCYVCTKAHCTVDATRHS